MKNATKVATILSTLALFAGPAVAQQWSGAAGIAAGFGYSAPPGVPMMPPRAAAPVEVSQDAAPVAPAPDRYVASVRRRAPAPVMAKVAMRRHIHHSYASRTFPRSPLLARAKRVGGRHRARIA